MTATPSATSHLRPILQSLRVGLHVAFAFLLGVGLLLALIERKTTTHPVTLIGVTVALGAVYLTGTVWENRFATARSTTPIPWGLPVVWLGLLVTLWLTAVLLAPSFLWLIFPLVMVAMHVLSPVAGALGVGALWALSTGLYWWRYPDEAGPGVLVGPLMGVVFAAGTFLLYRALHREATTQAALAAELLAAQEQLRTSEKQAGRMEERERLSREIHDTVAQSLSSIVLLARAARSAEDHAEQLTLIEQQSQDALDEARRFVRDLTAPALEEGFLDSVRAVIHRHSSTAAAAQLGLDIDLEVVGNEGLVVPENLAHVGLRCVQEGLANVVKHSGAQRARVTVGLWGQHFSIDIADNGRGIAAHRPEGSSGFGLSGLRSRLAAVGGSLHVESDNGGGTILNCRIPLTAEANTEPSP